MEQKKIKNPCSKSAPFPKLLSPKFRTHLASTFANNLIYPVSVPFKIYPKCNHFNHFHQPRKFCLHYLSTDYCESMLNSLLSLVFVFAFSSIYHYLFQEYRSTQVLHLHRWLHWFTITLRKIIQYHSSCLWNTSQDHFPHSAPNTGKDSMP